MLFNISVALKLQLQQIGLLVMRVGIGALFMVHGTQKFLGGKQVLIWVGSQMAQLGIHSYPLFWGTVAASTELFGGLLFALGLGTRLVSLLLSFMMVVAFLYHLHAKDDFNVYSHPLSLLVVFIGFIIAGAGTYSLDRTVHLISYFKDLGF